MILNTAPVSMSPQTVPRMWSEVPPFSLVLAVRSGLPTLLSESRVAGGMIGAGLIVGGH